MQWKLNSQKFLVKNLKNELEELRKEYNDVRSKFQAFSLENEALRKKNENNYKEIESLKTSLTNLEILYLEKQKATEKKNIEYLQEKLNESKCLLDFKENELETLRENIVKIRLRYKDLESEIAQKEQNIMELLKYIQVQ
ncbi:MAG: hypothetical protein ACFFAS_09665 [Promethearchaeota archaeon]